MSSFLNPMDIPVYLWDNGKATLTQLTEFERTPLKTPYLRRDYNGQSESRFHLVDEYFDYSSVKTNGAFLSNYPDIRVLCTTHPKASQQIPIEFTVPRNGYVRLELYDSSLRTVDVPVEKYITRGYHMIALDMKKTKPGTCYCQFRFEDFDLLRKIEGDIGR